jgi:hypothetical protein
MSDDDPFAFDDLYDAETLAWLDRAIEQDEPELAPPLPSRVSRWGRSAALGMVFTGIALGIQEVLEPREQHQIVVEIDDSGAPPHLPIELFLDPDSPAGSVCLIRRSVVPDPQL